jgi:hypothetical protein
MWRTGIQGVALVVLSVVASCASNNAGASLDPVQSDDAGQPWGDDVESLRSKSEIPVEFFPGEPIYVRLPYDDPRLTCCRVHRLPFCGQVYPGGRRPCNTGALSAEGGNVTANPYEYELRVIDGCPTIVEVGEDSCDSLLGGP